MSYSPRVMQKTEAEIALTDAALKKIHGAKPIRKVTFAYLATVDRDRAATAKRLDRASKKTAVDHASEGARKGFATRRVVIFNLVKDGVGRIKDIENAANLREAVVRAVLESMEKMGVVKCDRSETGRHRYYL